VGVATFGPLDLEAGATLRTPKPGWDGVPIRRWLEERLGVPVKVETDVNAAALAEARWGAARGCDPVVYVTVGTGIGGGVVVRGEPLHGRLHPEMGHLAAPVIEGDEWPGVCPFHGRCFEGLASGPAIAARVGRPAKEIPDEDPVWALCARYLGQLMANAALMLSPERIVLGGGVGGRPGMLKRVRAATMGALGGYLQMREDLVVAPHFEDPGLVGALGLVVPAG